MSDRGTCGTFPSFGLGSCEKRASYFAYAVRAPLAALRENPKSRFTEGAPPELYQEYSERELGRISVSRTNSRFRLIRVKYGARFLCKFALISIHAKARGKKPSEERVRVKQMAKQELER